MQGRAQRRNDSVQPHQPAPVRSFAHGFLMMLPLWTGAVPVGVAYGVAARDAGLSVGETQLMSLVVYSAAAQMSAVRGFETGAPLPVLAGTAMALNVHLLLIGLAVGRQARPLWWGRVTAAWFLTDGAYGVAASRGQMRLTVLVGAGVSMFLAWNAGTALGAVADHAAPNLQRLGLELVAPLIFLAVLVPLLRTRTAGLVALVAGMSAVVLMRFVPGGVAVLGAGVAGTAVGAWVSHRGNPSQDGRVVDRVKGMT